MRTLGMLIASGLISSQLAGCFTYSAGQHDVAARASLHSEHWPARDVDAVRSFHEDTPNRIFRYALKPGIELEEVNPEYALRVSERPDYIVHANVLTERGVARLYTDYGQSMFQSWDEQLYGFTPNASFLSSHATQSPRFIENMAELDKGPDASDRMLEYFAPGITITRTARRVALTRGVQMHIPLDIEADVRGILLHFTALYGNDYERRVLDTLRDRGWVVLSVSTESSITPPPPPHSKSTTELKQLRADVMAELQTVTSQRVNATDADVEAELSIKERELQRDLTRLSRAVADATRGSFQVCSDDDVAPVAREIAEAIDEKLAENAYAAEAALALFGATHPQFADAPAAIIGFSAGSLAAPAAAEYLNDRVEAVVLIGGGCDILSIGAKSTFTDGGIRLRCGDERIDSEMLTRLSEAYLQHSRLDPYHLADHLSHLPVLHVWATHDSWIPASNARRLAERLGSPDRLTHLGGHRSLFFFLPSQASRIGRWLKRATEPTRIKNPALQCRPGLDVDLNTA